MILNTIFTATSIALSLYIALPNENMDIIKRTLEDISDPTSPNYRNYLTLDEINSITAAKPYHRNRVNSWLKDSMLINNCINYPNHIVCHTDQNLTIPYKIRSDLTDSIILIDGIKPKRFKTKTKYNPDQGFVTTEVLQRVYNIPEKIQGTPNVGVAEFQNNNGFLESDLLIMESDNNIKNHTLLKTHIIGGNNLPPDGESVLDISMITQMTGDNSVLWYWNNAEWMYQFASDLMQSKYTPDVISISWGWSDLGQCTITPCNDSLAYIKRTDEEFAKISLRGITLVSSSGDSGSCGRSNPNCAESDRHLNPVYPTSSPYVLSVGGTFLVKNSLDLYRTKWTTPVCKHNVCSESNIEMPSMSPYVGWTTGGGISDIFNTPKWQIRELSDYLADKNNTFPNKKYFNNHGRGYPDVTGISNQCSLVSDGYWGTEAGTSCSSPIWAGVIAILNIYSKKPLGLVAPTLYFIKRKHPECFNKILGGNTTSTEYNSNCGRDFGFSSYDGQYWSPVSGLGSPNIHCLLKYI